MGTIIVCTDEEDFIPEESFDANQVGYIEEWCGSNGKKVYKVFDSPLFFICLLRTYVSSRSKLLYNYL